jgi:hypothetical protein
MDRAEPVCLRLYTGMSPILLLTDRGTHPIILPHKGRRPMPSENPVIYATALMGSGW